MTINNGLVPLLVVAFETQHCEAMIEHFHNMVAEFHKQDWEHCIQKAGKFVEAVSKALKLHVGDTLPPGRQFKAGLALQEIERKPVGSFPDSIRVAIPKACLFVYEIANNRGARHDPGEIDPNQMDATVVLATNSWILAELLRYAQKGSDFATVSRLVDSLIKKRYPALEDIEGRLYVEIAVSAREVLLLTLLKAYPKRLLRKDLDEAVIRHGYKKNNATEALQRMSSILDVDENGGMLLRSVGITEAEALMDSRTA